MPRTVKSTVSAAIAAILLSTLSAAAQELLFILRNAGELSELDTSDTNLGAVRRATQLPEGMLAVRLAGGRYLLLYAPLPETTLAVFDTRTWTMTVLPYRLQGRAVFEADDYRPRVFYRTNESIGVIAPPTFAPRELLATRTDAWGLDGHAFLRYSEATNSLLLARPIAYLQVEIISIDPDTGAIRGVIPADGVPDGMAVDNAGRRLYVHARPLLRLVPPLGFATELRVYDLDSLELIAKSGRYDLPWAATTLEFDSLRQQLVVGVHRWADGSGPSAHTVDADLTPRASVDFGYLQLFVDQLHLLPSTVRDRTFAVFTLGASAPSTSGVWGPGSGLLVGMDADSLQPVADADLHVPRESFGESWARGIADALLLAPPPPPAPLAVAVVGQHVELTWRNPGDATHFMVEAGTIPGRSNLGIHHVGNVTAWSVDNVPSGTYYVRVRAGNDVGPSLPSNEVVITVP